MTASRLLAILEHLNAKDNDVLYSSFPGWISSVGINECPLIAIQEMEILSIRRPLYRIHAVTDAEKKQKESIICLVEAFSGFDFCKCLTVSDFRKFIRSIDDLEENICVLSPVDLQNGWCHDIVDCYINYNYIEPMNINKKARAYTGENIIHLML